MKKKSPVKRKTQRKSQFGKLEVPRGVRPVSTFRKTNRPLLISPHGPAQPWLLQDETPAYSGAPSFGRRRRAKMGTHDDEDTDDESEMEFGRRRRRAKMGTLEGKRVNPSGYLSTWNGFPRTPPPSWNPLLLQGQNNFLEGVNDPRLSNVGFGRRRRRRA